MTTSSLLSTIATHLRGGFTVGLRERTHRIAGGLRERQLAGRYIGRIPYGYTRRMVDLSDGSRRWDGGLDVEPREAAGVRWAFDAWLAGASRRAIAVGLNARGYRTRMGERWAARAVRVMLANPIYTGRLVRYRRPHPDHYFGEPAQEIGRPFPAIVSDELFEAARRLAHANSPTPMDAGGRLGVPSPRPPAVHPQHSEGANQ